MTSDLERAILNALQGHTLSARELGERLNVRGHDVSRALRDLTGRGVLIAAPRDSTREASHVNPNVYTLTHKP